MLHGKSQVRMGEASEALQNWRVVLRIPGTSGAAQNVVDHAAILLMSNSRTGNGSSGIPGRAKRTGRWESGRRIGPASGW
jgi:hypothetical protein